MLIPKLASPRAKNPRIQDRPMSVETATADLSLASQFTLKKYCLNILTAERIKEDIVLILEAEQAV